ncbi:Cell division control protein 7 [Coemansia javaensis]|uniref:non-specific serine/threonine protein kinase n=1 Tax=Coemansia javaensis TaxID=2761396 RepID=A0A9W8H505_9FUNG|nr:Cell division control protein 7 [Coemansia javaensis]
MRRAGQQAPTTTVKCPEEAFSAYCRTMVRVRRQHPELFTPEGIPVVQPSAKRQRTTATAGSSTSEPRHPESLPSAAREDANGPAPNSAAVEPSQIPESGPAFEEEAGGDGDPPHSSHEEPEDASLPPDRDAESAGERYEGDDENEGALAADGQDSELSYAPSDAQPEEAAEDEAPAEGEPGGAGHSSHEEEEEEEEEEGEEAQEEIRELEELIPGLADQYRLLGRIGEGTFSTVYKAIDLRHERYDNSEWTMIFDSSPPRPEHDGSGSGSGSNDGDTPRRRHGTASRRARVVAIKKIYGTSSPVRIANEISILSDLRGSRFVVPLVTAMRRRDQVVVVLPYFRNDDFRRFYLDLPVAEMRWYLASLLGALQFTHAKGIMHRDIKPSNFLYDVRRRHGVLVDFGLAEREGDQEATRIRSRHSLHMDSSTAARLFTSFDQRGRPGVPRKDTRPGLRANRAGTRGFRAPEVLLKIPRQSVAIDIWSVGVILLCLLTRRFPFFQSTDDTEALLEIAVLYGRLEMERAVAGLGRTFLTNVPTVKDRGIRFESLAKAYNAEGFPSLPPEIFDLLRRLLALSPAARISAADALSHPFVANR